MNCAKCGSDEFGTVDVRDNPEGFRRRRRMCNGCGHRWTTYEIPHVELSRLQLNSKTLKDLANKLRIYI